MRSDSERLQDILQAIREIERYTVGGKQAFAQDTLIQSGVLYQIVIMGEAAGDISANLRERYSDIPWSQMIGMRNILAHQYFKIDLEIVWAVVEQNIPDLKAKFETILREL